MADETDARMFYSEHAAAFDAENAWDDLPETFHSVVETFLDTVDGDRVLDAGCGPGRDTNKFRKQGYDAVGVDIAAGMIRYADQNRDGEYVQGDLRDLPFEDEAFDGVWSNTAVFLLDEEGRQEAVEELYRVTADGGTGQISFKLGEGTIEKERGGDTVTQYLLQEDEALALVRDAGYTVMDHEVHATPLDYDFCNVFVER